MSEESPRESDLVLDQVLAYAEEYAVRVQIGPGELERLASDDPMERHRAISAVLERFFWEAFKQRRGWDE